MSNNEIKPPAIKQTIAEQDFEHARENLKKITEDAIEVLEGARDVATETNEPKAIDSYTSLLKAVGKLLKDPLDLSKTKKFLEMENPNVASPNSASGSPTYVQNNNTIFVGSTAELSKFLEDDTKKASIIEVESETDNVRTEQ